MSSSSSSQPSVPPPPFIGPYPVDRELGRGGMGVVYLARDPKLGRQVAIKVLPDAFTEDPVRLSRFEREARTLAAMNNRHIAMIFGLEQAPSPSGGVQQLLILEYVPGVSLSQRLSRGPLSVDESLRTCVQICEGLEAAHDQGVIHRDLKPDNVRVTPEGLVKVLDFGLATTTRDQTLGETTTTAGGSALTVQGMVMGTPGYMSPEQARGLATDRRTDIWSFACVLFECLTGAKAFWGDTVTDALAAILDREPDYSLLPQRTPNRVRDLLRRCLIKDPRRRMRDIGDARLELEDVLSTPQSGWYKAAESAIPTRSRLVARLTMPLIGPGGAPLSIAPSHRANLAVAPDGSSVLLVSGRAGAAQLFLRRMDAPEAALVPGAQGADAPIFSPDAQRAAFFEGGKLKVVSLSGGLPMPLASAPRHQGAAWGDDGNIYFIPEFGKGLFRVSPTGGAPEQVAAPDASLNERAFLAPEILPGSRHALVTVSSGSALDYALITAIDLRSGQRRPLVHGGCNPRLAPTGHLVFSRAANLLAVAFDPDRLDVFGQPAVIESGILAHAQGGGMQAAFGIDGTLALAPGSVFQPGADLLIAERDAEPRQLGVERRAFTALAAGASGTRLLVQISGAGDQLWMFDLARPADAPIRVGSGDASCPVLSPDAARVAYRTYAALPGGAAPRTQIVIQPADALAASPQSVAIPSEFELATLTPCSFCDRAEGGRVLAIVAQRPAGPIVLLAAKADDPRSVRVLGEIDAPAMSIDVSPDGRFVAYAAEVSGRTEVFVQPLAPGGTAARKQASGEGGWCPMWSSTGGELFFRSDAGAIAVRVAVEPALMVGRPRLLTKLPPDSSPRDQRSTAQLRDGQQFLALRASEDAPSVSTLSVALNWFEELRKRCPVPERSPIAAPPPRTASYSASRPGMATQVTSDSAAMRPPPKTQ